MAVVAGYGLNQPFSTLLLRNPSSTTRPWNEVWTSGLLPEGEPIGLSKILRSKEKPVLINYA